MTTSVPESFDLVMLDPHVLHFREEAHRLQMRRDDEEVWAEVAVLRLFPLSDPYRWISIRNEKGEEIGIIEDLRGLPADSLACVRKDLHHRYLVPHVTRIISVRTRLDLHEWTVETNRGEVTFLMRRLSESIKQIMPGMYALSDVDGNRYDVKDINALDEASRLLLESRL